MGTHSNLVLTVNGKKYVFYYHSDGYSQYEVFVKDILDLYKTKSYWGLKRQFEKLEGIKINRSEYGSPNGISWILDLGYIPIENDFAEEQYRLHVDFDYNEVKFEASRLRILSKRISDITKKDLKYSGVYIDDIMRKYYNLEAENSEQFKILSENYKNPIDVVERYVVDEDEDISIEEEPSLEELGFELQNRLLWREYEDEFFENATVFMFNPKYMNPDYVYITGLRIAGYPEVLKRISQLQAIGDWGKGTKSFYDSLSDYDVFLTDDKVKNTPKHKKVSIATVHNEGGDYWLDINKMTMEQALAHCR